MDLPVFLGTLLLATSQSSAPKPNPAWQAVFERGSDIYIANADGSHAQRLVKNGWLPKWSPDGKRFLFQREHEVLVFDIATRTERKIYDYDPKEQRTFWDFAGYCWDPLRPAVLIAKPHGTDLALVPFEGTEMQPSADILRGSYMKLRTYAPAWSPSGQTLAFVKGGDVWMARRGTPSKKGVSILAKGAANDYYDEANRLAPLASFNDAELGASGITPFYVDEVAWTSNERKLAFHYQRVNGTGVSEIGYLDLIPADRSIHTGSAAYRYKVHWLLQDVFSPRICPDGKTLSYIKGYPNPSVYLTDWAGKHSRKLFANATGLDWRSSARLTR